MNIDDIIEQRAELITEIFLDDLKPISLLRASGSEDWHYLVAFRTQKNGLVSIVAKAFGIKTPVPEVFTFKANRELKEVLFHSNLPLLLLVVDVAKSKVGWNWSREAEAEKRGSKVRVPVVLDSEVNRAGLLSQIEDPSYFEKPVLAEASSSARR